MPNRNVEGGYRYGYQGEFAEKEPELGTGINSFQLRLWDSRIGRWSSPDPYGQFASPYLGMGNNPMNGVDPDGGCWDSEGNPCPDGAIGDTTLDGQGNTWTFGESGWDTNAYDDYGVTVTADLSDIADARANQAYWAEINASAEILNKIEMLNTGMTSEMRGIVAREQEYANSFQILSFEQPQVTNLTIANGPLAWLSGGGALNLAGKGYALTKTIGKFTVYEKTVKATNLPGQAVAKWTKVFNQEGKLVKMYKDAYKIDGRHYERAFYKPKSFGRTRKLN